MKKTLKTLSLIISCILIIFTVTSCAPKTTVSEESNYSLYSNVYYGDHERNYMDLCLPSGKTGTVGLILMIHGGGWIFGDKSCYTDSIKNYCSTYGYVSASINYRYADGNNVTADDILDDVSMALMKIKELSAEHNITVNKVLLTGGSAGAHLSLLYAYKQKNVAPITPVAVVSFCGPTNLADPELYKNGKDVVNMISKISGIDMEKNTIEHALPLLKNVSPITYVDENTVPTVISHGTLDSVVSYSNAVALDKILTDKKVKHDFITFPNSNHGLESDNNCMDRANELLLQYAHQYLN